MDKKARSTQETSQQPLRRRPSRHGELTEALCRLQDPRVLGVFEDSEEDPTTQVGWGPWMD